MTVSHHIKRTLLLSFPLVGSQLAQIAINTTDIIMLGWNGTYSLASGVLGTQAVFVFFILGAGFAHAVVPLAAEAFAKEDMRNVRRVVRMGFWLTGIISLISMPVLWYFEPILLALGQDTDISALATDYIHVAQGSLFFALWALVLRNFFASVERAQIVFWAIIPGIFLNIFLNYLLIFGNFGAPKLGVVGAAWASLATNFIIFATLLIWLLLQREYREFELLKRLWRPDWEKFFHVAKLGVPISIMILAEVGMFTGSSILMGWIGPVELAAHGIALQIAAIAFMVPLGISGAVTIRVGNAYGRQNIQDIGLAAKAAVIISILYALIMAAIFVSFADQLVNLFLDFERSDAETVAAVAVSLVIIAGVFQLVDGLQVIIAGILRGFQDTTIPMLLAVICYGPLGIFAAFILGNYLEYGGRGVWAGLTIGLTFTTFFAIWRYSYMFRKLKFRYQAGDS